MSYPSGLTLNYQYDDLNQVKKVTTIIDGQAETVVDQVSYLPFGPIDGINFGNGQNYSANYDDGYRLIDYSYGADVTAVYAYDNNHNITTITRELSANNDGFSYDHLDRLTHDSGELTTFTYDRLGNRTSQQQGTNPILNYTIDSASNKLLNVGAVKPRGYDANGNTLSAPDLGDHVWLYNQANRMSRFGIGKTVVGEYFHNGIGQRVHKKVSGIDHLFIYDEQGQLVHESAYVPGEILWDRETIWLGSRPVARVETKYISGVFSSQNVYYIQTDHLNTPRWITDDAGTRIWSWESDAFGTTLPDEDVDGDGTDFVFNLRFPGQYFDVESKLHYNYFRDYEPGIGRYVQSDPIGLDGGMNTFGYVMLSPLMYSDSKGLQTESEFFYCWATGCPEIDFCSRYPDACNPPQPETCEEKCEKESYFWECSGHSIAVGGMITIGCGAAGAYIGGPGGGMAAVKWCTRIGSFAGGQAARYACEEFEKKECLKKCCK